MEVEIRGWSLEIRDFCAAENGSNLAAGVEGQVGAGKKPNPLQMYRFLAISEFQSGQVYSATEESRRSMDANSRKQLPSDKDGATGASVHRVFS